MKLRMPAVPLITHSPYFSIWSMGDELNQSTTQHWTGKPQKLTGLLKIGGQVYRFMGENDEPAMKQLSLEVTATDTVYSFECPLATLECRFTSPLLLDDYKILSRPLTYLFVKVTPKREEIKDAEIEILVNDEICLDHALQHETVFNEIVGKNFHGATIASKVQNPLNCSGDDLRIDWGTFYLAANNGMISVDGHTLGLTTKLDDDSSALFAFGYDENKSIQYFHVNLDAFWKTEYKSFKELLENAFEDYEEVAVRCDKFSKKLREDAEKAGGKDYADILTGAYRQTIAAHQICKDTDGKILFISKECFSNGCAATADVSYPSIPLFLLYNPELIFGMLRPVFRYSRQKEWKWDYAPHDAGRYPLLNGQVYCSADNEDGQMPVEECGNLLVMTAAATLASKDTSFAKENLDLLERWANYLLANGLDPKNQLCTDDFAGHLAHNCNLSIKAIMGITSFAIIERANGNTDKADTLTEKAREMAREWCDMAKNNDGTYRLAFDRADTFSMKYNAVFDFIFKTNIFPPHAFDKELESYLTRLDTYGMPLDNRADYTKSDWLIWSASMLGDKESFEKVAKTLFDAFNETPHRVPMMDWYDTKNAARIQFQNRTVQGGLFMKLLMEKGI